MTPTSTDILSERQRISQQIEAAKRVQAELAEAGQAAQRQAQAAEQAQAQAEAQAEAQGLLIAELEKEFQANEKQLSAAQKAEIKQFDADFREARERARKTNDALDRYLVLISELQEDCIDLARRHDRLKISGGAVIPLGERHAGLKRYQSALKDLPCVDVSGEHLILMPRGER
jgi:predicted  nucleic acid-binding Zn-ribbon protein